MYQLRLQTRHPEFAEEILLAHGALSVSLTDGEDTPVLEPLPGETPLWPHTVVLGLFADEVDSAPAVQALHEILPDGDSIGLDTEPVEDQDWVRRCLEDMNAMHFGGALWICPRHRQIEDPHAVVVRLDPGLAFGTGTHPSTALCLRWLATAELRGKTVLDYGCGSGVLAIAALKLGARSAEGVDLDPQALIASRDNARENAVSLALHLPAEFRPRTYDLVLANILAAPLIAMAPMLGDCVAPGGHIILAGLLDRQADEVAAAYEQGFEIERCCEDGWTRLVGTRRG